MFSSLILEGQRLIISIPLNDFRRFFLGCPCQSCRSDKGFFLCDGEAAAADLLGEALVNVRHHLLECGAVESLAQNGCPANDVLSSLHLFGVAVEHFGFDFIPKGFSFGLGFFNQGFQFLQSFDFGCDFDSRHNGYLLYSCLVGLPTLKSSSSHVNGASVSLVYGLEFVSAFG